MTIKQIKPDFLQKRSWKSFLLMSCFFATLTSTALAEEVLVAGNGKNVGSVNDRFCYITSDNDLYCFGKNDNGQVGNGTTDDVFTPTRILFSVKKVALTDDYSCALREKGDVYCWGNSEFSQLSTGAKPVLTPKKVINDVADLKLLVQRSAGNVQELTAYALKNNGDLYKWGYIKDKSTFLPTKILSNVDVMSISDSSCALLKDKSLYCWGNNNRGQVGNGTTSQVSSPVRVLSNVKQLSSVNITPATRCAIKSNNDLYCWGSNDYGQAGNGSNSSVLKPTKVLAGVKKLYQSNYNACAINTKNELYCWGTNNFGQTGTNSKGKNVLTPTKVLSNVNTANIFENYMCAVTTNKDLYCWGQNDHGQIGNGSKSSDVSTPTKILTRVSKVNSFSYPQYTCATKTDGDLYCWGDNAFERIPESKDEYVLSPVKVAKDVSKTSYSDYTICNVMTNGTASCSGTVTATEEEELKKAEGIADIFVSTNYLCTKSINSSLFCALRNKLMNYVYNPKKPTKVASNVATIGSTSFIDTKGQLYAWGGNGDATVGVNKMFTTTPEKVLDNVASKKYHGQYSCALKKNGELYCWGNNHHSQLGIGNSLKKYYTPSLVLTDVAKMYDSSLNGCAITNNSDLYCWGFNLFGQVSSKTTSPNNEIGKPSFMLSNVKKVGIGSLHICALTNNNDLFCWGNNQSGQIGIGTTSKLVTARRFVLGDVKDFEVETASNCAVKNNGDLYCWGANSSGQIGIESNGKEVNTPTKVLSKVSKVFSKNQRTCALKTTDELYCWGKNDFSQVGYGGNKDVHTPVRVIAFAKSVYLFNDNTCAITGSTGALYCWGKNDHSQLDYRTDKNLSKPTLISSGMKKVVVGDTHSCGLTNKGILYCWGTNTDWSIRKETKDIVYPMHVITFKDVEDFFVGSHSCALTTSKDMYCWGNANYGNLGLGNSFKQFSAGKASSTNPVTTCISHWNYRRVGYGCDNGELGACLNSGALGCYGTLEDPSVVCDAVKGTPKAEMCDGIDNDCDGQIDEDYALLGKTCYVGTGNCKTKGVYICNADGTGTKCSANLTNQCVLLESDVNNNGIPDLYEKAGDIKNRIVRPNTKLIQSFVVTGKNKVTLYLEWFNGASYYTTAKVNDKKLTFTYYVRIKLTNKKTGKVIGTTYRTLSSNKLNIVVSKNTPYKFTVDYRVKIRKGAQVKETPWSPKVTF